MPRRPLVVAALLLLAIASLSPVAQAADVTVVVEAEPGNTLRFRPATISVQPGDRVTILFFNNDSIPHTFDIDEFNIHTDEVQAGASTTVTFTVPQPTTVQYYCDVPGHRAAGMFGTLRVGAPTGGPLDTTLIAILAIIAVIVVAAVVLLVRGRRRGGKP